MLARAQRLFNRLNRRAAKYARVFGTADGQWVLADMAKRNFALPNSTSAVPGDPHRSTLQEGQRLAIAKVFGTLGTSHDQLVHMAEQMAKESTDEE